MTDVIVADVMVVYFYVLLKLRLLYMYIVSASIRHCNCSVIQATAASFKYLAFLFSRSFFIFCISISRSAHTPKYPFITISTTLMPASKLINSDLRNCFLTVRKRYLHLFSTYLDRTRKAHTYFSTILPSFEFFHTFFPPELC